MQKLFNVNQIHLWRDYLFTLFLILFIFFFFPLKLFGETAIDFYMNQFYSQSNEASRILKEIEINLREGSRKKVCSRQREAAKLALLANKSLIKAYELAGHEAPMEAIRANEKRWDSILKNC